MTSGSGQNMKYFFLKKKGGMNVGQSRGKMASKSRRTDKGDI